MTTDEEQLYGPKADRLLRIRKIESLDNLVLPIFPIAPLPTVVAGGLAQADDAAAIYAAALEEAFPLLTRSVEDVCGSAPWIVRSAGNEDLTDHINAGGYESLICSEPQALIRCIAAVAMSGSTEHARRQLALSGRYDHVEAIPCFVQPLLKIDVCGDVGHDHSPYLDTAVLDRMEAVCNELMQTFDFIAIDCEWGLETTLGFVSVTTVMPRNPQLMNVVHTIGFGFASAQSTGSRATALVLRPACSDLRLWRGRHLRATTVQRLHLLQARPAYSDDAFRDRDVLTDACRETLIGRYDVVEAGLLMLGAQSSGRALVAPDLMSAWRRYLALNAREQADVAVVIVDEGSAEEHAGIMFRQQKTTCVRMDTRRMPAGADCVVIDRGTCILGDSTLLRSIQSERRRELVLPDDCALVFTDEVLAPGGELTRDCVEVLSQLRRLPVAREVKERLFARSEQPMSARWMQRDDGVVESPSLLAAIWRSKNPGYAGECCALTEFARDYERAFQVSQNEPQRELRTLFALSSVTRTLVASGDLRIVLALLDCEAATSWVSSQTLRRLVDSAAVQLKALRRDNAVLILESVAFVRTECVRLPVYELDDAVSYLDALAHDLEDGLFVEAMVSIRSLELPIASGILLARQALDNPAVLEPVDAFRQSVASFRGMVSGGSTTARLPLQLNDTYLTLRGALYEAGLENVAEQIRGSLIETYDASLKGLLWRVVEEGDAGSYRRYLIVMQWWIEFLNIGSLSERDAAVLQRFQIWLRQWTDDEMPESFEIQDRNWRFEFDAIVVSHGTPQRYENPHVLHNLLHQYSLAGLRLDALGLPRRVQALEHFCSTFSSRSTKVLRFERELLEIQIPMGTHKASYVFTPRQISVEWTEPPDCHGGEIARILAFEVFLDRFRIWMFPALTVRREQVLGTWTLFIRLNAQGSDPWDYEHLWHFVVATRLLFDASYDFSYVANEAVDGFAERFDGLEWKEILTTLIRYRALIEDRAQYVALHALPMSSTVAAMACSRIVRGLLLRCLRRGFDYCRALIDGYAHWLNEEVEDNGLWSDRYESLRQASLFLAAKWPREALSELVGRGVFNVGDDLIAACLFKRSDLADDLRQVVAAGSMLSGMPGMIVRHAPEIAIAGRGASLLAAQLVGTGMRFRRAKHLLVARFGDCLDQDILTGLLQDLDTVPWGYTADAEQAIQTQILMSGPVCRFELEKGIDWTTLDSWPTLVQRRPVSLGPTEC
ncbi:pyruvate phosphate dikinase, PEP/pyruvate binding domain protein [Pseudomonas fluorescens]|uniref:Pyruvate phosphate dikinase, PEP/pyruvate binding domain protein n=1 Tax=Pseudomonas fluorescens TaxID=294 RepID=A0A0P8X0H4_PSEFL|nr:hypothetical protein [Pseudomonas fluorescens]KPU59175.1 pyruvate phosphate dikinase, PEP/pyruvate binding domain protein [Pseudomonas fluorescens]